jgi:hypothetical protein
MTERIEVVRRPGWSSRSTFFARLIDEQTGEHRDCEHCHSSRELAQRCGERMLTE